MINVKSYKSYRQFLRDYYEDQKKADPAASIRSFARALKMSPAALNMILSGDRNLTVHKMFEVGSSLKLNHDEMAYFEVLVHYEQAQSKSEKNYYKQRLEREIKTKSANTMRITRKELLSEWYLPAFLVYLVDRAFDPKTQEFLIDFNLVEKKFGIDKERTLELFESLMNMGALEVRRDDKAHFVIEKVGGFLTNQSYVLKVLEETSRRLKDRNLNRKAFFDAHCLTLAKQRLPEFTGEYKKLVHRFILEDDPNTDEVAIYQTLAAVFPVT